MPGGERPGAEETGGDAVVAVVREWIQKAENDLRNAAHTLELRERCPTDTVCFHTQQCVEKYLKALLTLAETEFPRSHRIDELLALVPSGSRPDLSVHEQDSLT